MLKGHAVLVGIDDYADPEIPPLHHAVSDAEALRDFLLHISPTFSPERLHLITNANATLRNIRIRLTEIARACERDDIVFVYFAGHGSPEQHPPNLQTEALGRYIVPYDAEYRNLFDTGLEMENFGSIFNRSPAETRVVLLDT